MSTEKPRQIAVRVLKRRGTAAGWVENLLDDEWAAAGPAVAPADRGLVRELIFGVVRWEATLDWLIARRTRGRTQKETLQILLRLGLYQMFWLDRIPDHAAVHESVEMAKTLGFGPQAGFINAVLRGCLRERAVLEKELQSLRITAPALGWSHPEWLCARWEKRWGSTKLQELLKWNNTPPPTFGRVNTLKTTAADLLAQLEREGVLGTPRPVDWTPEELVIELRGAPALATLPSFQQGLFYAQDPSTLLAVGALDPQEGETVLDLCAAPGGKTTFIAQRMRNRATITAYDPEARRQDLIRENCARLGVSSVTVVDQIDPAARFDRVLVDAPCSNSGVMRRRVELRWRMQPPEIERLRALQGNLLMRAANHVRPGGTLVYSTCSLEAEENEQVVKEFMASHGQFRLENERALLPFVEEVDGAFVAKFKWV